MTTTGMYGRLCDLECWCHVPMCGVLKPPCCLCVTDSCSLTRKRHVDDPSVPSDPEPSATAAETTQFNPQIPMVNGETPSKSVIDTKANRHRWQLTIARALIGLSWRSGKECLSDDIQLLPLRNDESAAAYYNESFQESEFNNNNLTELEYPRSFDGGRIVMDEIYSNTEHLDAMLW